jgi:DNA-3-methyladenine glycosylase
VTLIRTENLKKLPRSFYLRPTIVIARELLGKHLVRTVKGATLVGRIVETEAYRGKLDPASHAYRGRTLRNEVMFKEGGHLYVYFTYGMHFCSNVVTGTEGIGEAVLIRALEPLEGIELMARNRFEDRARHPSNHKSTNHHLPAHQSPTSQLTNLTNGPAKLCQALGMERKENGVDLTGNEIYILNAPTLPASQIGTSERIGITKGKEKKWRFYIKGNAWVSR